MIQKFVEATDFSKFNWGKFLIQMFEPKDYGYVSKIGETPLLLSIGHSPRNFWMMDLQTKEGAAFVQGSYSVHECLEKHKIWVCPMYEPTLTKLLKMDWASPLDLPDVIELTEEESFKFIATGGYRRPGTGWLKLTCGAEERMVENIHLAKDVYGMVNNGHDDLYDLGFSVEALNKHGLKIEVASAPA